MSYIMPEKGQMNEYGIEAFGIPLTSRHGVAMELSQMLRFSYYVASVGLVKCIESVLMSIRRRQKKLDSARYVRLGNLNGSV